MAGIYVERTVRGSMDELWGRTQEPSIHQRWDLRFSTIAYLPRIAGEPQCFLYETRLVPGISVRGTGETLGERNTPDGSATSALKFAAETPWALIDQGSGYWKYIPVPDGVKFLTWYDYRTRFSLAGRLVDRLFFRPLLGWATAWSFDRLALWIEREQTPETSLAFARIHGLARLGIAAVWLWHGLVPKLLFRQQDEQTMLLQAGVPASTLAGAMLLFGSVELLIAVVMLLTWERRTFLLLNAAAMLLALAGVAMRSPRYLAAAFNPVTLNGLMIALSVAGWVAAGHMPLARRCRRHPEPTP